MYFDQGRPQ